MSTDFVFQVSMTFGRGPLLGLFVVYSCSPPGRGPHGRGTSGRRGGIRGPGGRGARLS